MRRSKDERKKLSKNTRKRGKREFEGHLYDCKWGHPSEGVGQLSMVIRGVESTMVRSLGLKISVVTAGVIVVLVPVVAWMGEVL